MLSLTQSALFAFIGGFLLFFYGIERLSGALQRLAVSRLRTRFAAVVKNRLLAALFGVAAAALTQTSTAPAVTTVGLVNAGLLRLIDGIAFNLGAALGASLILQLALYHPAWLVIPTLAVALLLRGLRGSQLMRDCGDTLFGLTLLMLGLILMTDAVALLRGVDDFRRILIAIDQNLWLAVAAAALLAAAVQSSTAIIALILAVASGGLLSFASGVALILGANAGGCSAPLLASRRTSIAARRMAVAQTLINLATIGLCFIFFHAFVGFAAFLSPGPVDFVVDTARESLWFDALPGEKPYLTHGLALANTLYATLCLTIFLPLLGLIARWMVRWQGNDEQIVGTLHYIDYQILNTPSLALTQARAEVRAMGRLALDTLEKSRRFIGSAKSVGADELTRQEQQLDLIQRELTSYLVELSHRTASSTASQEIAQLIRMAADYERIGDHCQSLVRLVQRKDEWGVTFSQTAQRELEELAAQTHAFLASVIAGIESSQSNLAEPAREFETAIDRLEEELRNRHLQRLNTGECAVRPGLIFIDMIQALEEISDHAYSVAKCCDGIKE